MDRQKSVIECFEGNFELILTKREIMDKAGLHYYHNSSKHAGEVLSRMVNNGILNRTAKGKFKLNPKKIEKSHKQEKISENQYNLFGG